ncbi:MAG: DivIVA domain-containing protein [Actinobacteria bacterium]|nr:DivIVA domain-containing protein [Actinomycetota bacterium]
MAADSSGPIDPDRILDKTFATVKKGVDPVEVQRYLLKISNQLKTSQTRVAELERQVEQSRRQSAEHDPIDPSNLTKLLGEETTRVLDAAQSAAAEIRAKAEENVARLLRDSREETIRLREETDALVARRREEAEQIAEEIRENAAAQRESAEAEAAAIIEASKQQGREMVLEAQQVRQRMLEDLARRRQSLREQIEQLKAGRDRISAAYDIVRETLAVATEELDVALPEARFAAEVASLQIVDSEPDATVTPIVTAEELGVPVIDVSPADRPRNVEIPAEPKPSAPKLTVVPPVQEAKTDKSSDSTSENAAPEQPVDATPLAEDPREGRHSSSVRVVRTSSGKAADVFARLRQEGEDEVAQSGESPDTETTAPVSDTAIAEAKIAVSNTVDEADEEVEADSDADQAFIVARNEAVAAIESSLARRIKRELSDEQNELLSTLRSVKGNMTAIAFLPTPESQLERYEDIALPALADAAEAGGSIAPVKGRGTSRASVGDLAADLASAIVGPLRDRLERAVSESAGDRDDLAQRIRSTFREWKGQRVDESVAFGVLSACNRGILDRLPKGSQVRWVVAAGDAPSPDCEDNALGGATERGAAFPTGHNAPPLHPGCHCVVLPAL